MLPKPADLGPEYASQFSDASVIAAYHHRPPYPEALFPFLAGLVRDEPRIVLDLGCGTGDLARPLAALVERVDAVDIAEGMIAKGRTLPGGDQPALRWIHGPAEEVALTPPYALATAAESLHWMEWATLLPRLLTVLTAGGVLALVTRDEPPQPWRDGVIELIAGASTNRLFQRRDLIEELERRGLFTPVGTHVTALTPFSQPVAAYVESVHSRNGFSRDRMAPEAAAAFDMALTALVSPFAVEGVLTFPVGARVTWGRPCRP